MSVRRKTVWKITLCLILVANGVALVAAVLLQSVLGIILVLGVAGFDLYWYYTGYKKKRELRYPLVPPEGKGDVYLPRTDIPRPIHADVRAMEEKRRKFAQLDRWRRRKSKKGR